MCFVRLWKALLLDKNDVRRTSTAQFAKTNLKWFCYNDTQITVVNKTTHKTVQELRDPRMLEAYRRHHQHPPIYPFSPCLVIAPFNEFLLSHPPGKVHRRLFAIL